MEVRRLKPDELQHHGVKGQRWGIRRYQNKDGSLTTIGKNRLDALRNKKIEQLNKKIEKNDYKFNKKANNLIDKKNGEDRFNKLKEKYDKQKKYTEEQIKKIKNMSYKELLIIMNNPTQNQLTQNLITQQTIIAGQQAAIQASNQTISLAVSGGTNPFMFG